LKRVDARAALDLLAAPAPPWPDAAPAGALADTELRLLWVPAPEHDDTPRRARIDALLRRVLAPQVGVAPEDLRFGREAKGRPFLRHDGAPDFNLSDTAGGTLIALTRAARLGVDLERHERAPPAAKLAARYFAPAESAALSALPAAEAAREFIRLWTAKEASCKATGTGIFGWLPHWQFAPGVDTPQLRGLPEHAGDVARWRFARVSHTAEHTAVLALQDASPALKLSVFSLRP
jgi:4'-phosphopantetheinyl transferase